MAFFLIARHFISKKGNPFVFSSLKNSFDKLPSLNCCDRNRLPDLLAFEEIGKSDAIEERPSSHIDRIGLGLGKKFYL